jgi:hypothetical protein
MLQQALHIAAIDELQLSGAQAAVDSLTKSCAANDTFEAFAATGAVFDTVLTAAGGMNQFNWDLFEPYDYSLLDAVLGNATVQSWLHGWSSLFTVATAVLRLIRTAAVEPSHPFTQKNMSVFLALIPDQMISMAPKYEALLDLNPRVSSGRPFNSGAGNEALTET